MTLREKAGQLTLVNGGGGHVPDHLAGSIRAGEVGAVLNEVDPDAVDEMQRIAVEESPHGIPLLIGRDVIHGFRTVFPIPLGQAATWSPERVRQGARIAALEAARTGVNWTFAPMVDISRDPRWGRIAESLGEDPYLASVLAAAMVEGFQGDDLTEDGHIAACAKHFAGYGASESGKDYNTTNIPERELRDVHLPPFRAALEAGAATFMASFSDLDGIPASASRMLLTGILREEWGFEGFVVSDWDSIPQLITHGLAEDRRAAAREALLAGLDMDMAGYTYLEHLPSLVESGEVPEAAVDAMVAAVLRVKLALGLFEDPRPEPEHLPAWGNARHLEAARAAARESVVLLKNRDRILPLDRDRLGRVAVIGHLADAPAEQLGTWVFDGDPDLSVTPLAALRDVLGESVDIRYARGLDPSWDRSHDGFPEAVDAATDADVALVFLGEDAILSGEAHCRADIGLPGAQSALLEAVHATGTPVVAVLMTGRPLALERDLHRMDALLCAWHPGSMAGPALTDLLFGDHSPSGRLPVTFPRVIGQIPIYYGHKNTGRPATEETWTHLDDIPRGAGQVSVGNTSFHLDTHYTPLFPFGFGLTYGEIHYEDFRFRALGEDEPGQASHEARLTDRLELTVRVHNRGTRAATEVVQLYVRDPVASVTRPVRELKRFARIHLEAGESRQIRFELTARDLVFHGRDMRPVVESGRFEAWVGGSSAADLHLEFRLHDPDPGKTTSWSRTHGGSWTVSSGSRTPLSSTPESP
ncbi:MAG: glycoside hydrolase family 3 N-terminal domain-containing protein [Candidatus Longimicrobiales bacterium M2_2A_002]